MTPPDSAPMPQEAVDAEPAPIPDDELYWAARSPEALATVLKEKERSFFEFAQRRGYTAMWSTMLAEHYGMSGGAFSFGGFDAEGVDFEGEDGELIRFRIAEMRQKIRARVTKATKTRPAFQAEARNAESSSMSQVDAVDAIATSVYETGFGESAERDIVERCDVLAKMWAWERWDVDGGPMVEVPVGMLPDGSPAPGRIMKRTGQSVTRVLHPWEIVSDPSRDLREEDQWAIVRERRSRWELMAEMGGSPELRDYLKGVSVRDEVAYEACFGFDPESVSDDDILCKWFYHTPSQDIPNGRCALIVGDKVLAEADWPGFDMPGAPQLPLVPMMSATMVGSTLGYSDAWDMAVLQQMLTQLTSDAATNIATFGRQVIVATEGLDYQPQQLVNGMSVIEKKNGTEDPHGLTLSQLPPASQWFIGFLLDRFRKYDPNIEQGPNLKSGTMAALFDNIATEVVYDKEAALTEFRDKLCNLKIAMLRKHATVPQLVSIVGQGERHHVQEFSREAFKGVQRIRVKPVSPVMKSRANQMQLLEILMKVPGAIKNPMQVVEMFATGQWKEVYKAAEASLHLIAWENEQFRNGTRIALEPAPPRPPPPPGMPPDPPLPPNEITPDVPVYVFQNPYEHIPEHAAELANPEVARDQAKARAITAHIMWHLRVYLECPPPLAQILGFPPPMAPAPPPTKALPSGGNDKKPVEKTNDGVPLPKPAEAPPLAASQPQ